MKKQTITETVSSIVYHATHTAFATSILSEKQFKLSGIYSHKREWGMVHNPDLHYYMSVTRNKTGSFHKDKSSGVIFVLDGNWFNARYNSKPVDYYVGTLNTREIKDKFSRGKTKKGPEFEDRIFSAKPTIPFSNIRDVIKEIHVLIDERAFSPPDNDPGGYNYPEHAEIRKLLKVIKTEGLENITYFYGGDWYRKDRNRKDIYSREESHLVFAARRNWLGLTKRGTTDPEMLKLIIAPIPNTHTRRVMGWDTTYKFPDTAKDIPFGRRIDPNDWLGIIRNSNLDRTQVWRELYYKSDYGKLSKPSLDFLTSMMYKYMDSFVGSEWILKQKSFKMGTYWISIFVDKFNEDYQYMRQVDQASPTEKEKLDLVIRKSGAKINTFGEVMAKKWWFFMDDYLQEYKKKMQAELNMTESATGRTLIVFHGSNKKFDKFSEKAKRVANDFFGGGIAYTTDDQSVALTYSRAMTYRYGGEEYLYKIQLTLSNIFDVDTVFSGKELVDFTKYVRPEDFLRSAGLLTAGTDKYKVLAQLESGSLSMDGKAVFKGLSKGLVDSSGAEAILKKMGYDGLRYNGGDNMGAGKHNVYIPYYSKSIKILGTFRVQRKSALKEDTGIGHMIFSRAVLPQIRDFNEFLTHIRLIGSNYDIGMINPEAVKATQLDGFDQEKIDSLIKSGDKIPPIIISSDDYILDGHHRWMAAKLSGKEVQAYRIYLPILELIRVAMDLYGITYSDDITEIFGGLKPTLYHNLNFKKLYYSVANDALDASFNHEIKNVHVKKGPSRVRTVPGNSLTRNPQLQFGINYDYMLELDRDKIRTTNKLHVIDGDMTYFGGDPHDPDIHPENSRTRFMTQNRWRAEMHRRDYVKNELQRDPPTGPFIPENQFAEEFVEGDLRPLSKYLRAIWVKKDNLRGTISRDGSHDWSDVMDLLGSYAFSKNVAIKEYPSGKDLTSDYIGAAMEEDPLVKFSRRYKSETGRVTPSKAFGNLSFDLDKIRKSINTK